MNLLLFIKYPTHFSRVVVSDTDTVLAAIESTNDRIRLCENISALNKLEKIFSGQTRPLADYLAGNSYFGKVIFKFTKTGRDISRDVGELSVKVYSALGATVDEHDERYKRLKAARLSSVQDCKEDNPVIRQGQDESDKSDP